jgi:hypothetical protein
MRANRKLPVSSPLASTKGLASRADAFASPDQGALEFGGIGADAGAPELRISTPQREGGAGGAVAGGAYGGGPVFSPLTPTARHEALKRAQSFGAMHDVRAAGNPLAAAHVRTSFSPSRSRRRAGCERAQQREREREKERGRRGRGCPWRLEPARADPPHCSVAMNNVQQI